jgi:signal transduction histidine kinase
MIDSTGVRVNLDDVVAVSGSEEVGIWAGSPTRGLMRLDRGEAALDTLPFPIGDPAKPPSVVSVYAESDSRLWVGTAEGLVEYDAVTLQVTWLRHDPADPESLGAGWVTEVLQTGDGSLWIGTGESGVWRRSPEGRLTGFRHDPEDPGSLSGDYVTALAVDDDGSLWVGTRSHGLNRCRADPFHCERYGVEAADGLRHHYVTAVHRDQFGTWWVGTAGGGLHRVLRSRDGSVEGFEHFGHEQGLSDTTIVSFLDDDDGSLWLGSRRGLSRFSRDRRRVANYLASDGLVSELFNRGAAARDAEFLYFGSVRGVVYVAAGSQFRPAPSAPLAFTGALNLSTGEPLTGVNWSTPRVSIPHGEVLQFSFALLDFESGQHRYAYRLSDGGNWVSLENTRQITFGDLPPGRHELQIRGQGARGQMTEASLSIEVIPPFWMTHWFRVAVVFGVLLTALLAHHVRLASLQRRNLALQQLHEERERALEKLQRSEAELSEAAQGLRRLASRLETAKEEERQHISRELHDELGQTLTAAKISLQMLTGKQADADAAVRLQAAVGMMDSMIGQVRAISLDLRPPLLDEAGLVPALKSELKQVSAQTDIPIELKVSAEFPALDGDLETTLFRVIQEAVSNSLRHSGASRVSVSLTAEYGELRVVIEDDGCGFEVDVVRSRAHKGEHLGLLGLDERVTAAGGTVKLESEPGAGTRLRVRIPMRQ